MSPAPREKRAPVPRGRMAWTRDAQRSIIVGHRVCIARSPSFAGQPHLYWFLAGGGGGGGGGNRSGVGLFLCSHQHVTPQAHTIWHSSARDSSSGLPAGTPPPREGPSNNQSKTNLPATCPNRGPVTRPNCGPASTRREQNLEHSSSSGGGGGGGGTRPPLRTNESLRRCVCIPRLR